MENVTFNNASLSLFKMLVKVLEIVNSSKTISSFEGNLSFFKYKNIELL